MTTGPPEPTEQDPAKGAAEPDALIDGGEDDADTASRLSMAASDPPASWAGPDNPPTNKERSARLAPSEMGTPAQTATPQPKGHQHQCPRTILKSACAALRLRKPRRLQPWPEHR